MQHLSLATRLSLAFAVVALALLGAGGAWQLAAERDDLDDAVERELRMLGRSLQVSFENALRDRQAEDVAETLEALDRLDPSVGVVVFDARGEVLASSDGADVDDARAVTSGYRVNEDAAELRLPLDTGERRARLVLVRTTTDVERDLQATRRRVAGSLAVYVFLLLLTTVIATRFWVGAPLARMVAHIRRVRAGDLSVPPHPSLRRDEIGETVHEFERLVEDLASARARLEAETEARRGFERVVREMDKLATLGQLAAGLAHEIGSPLQVLEGRLTSLEKRADDPDETRRLAGIAREQAARITRIVARLSNLTRRPTSPTRFDPREPVRSILALLEPEARRRGVRLEVELSDVPAMHADPDALQQITLNLVRNAIEATSEGGTVSVRLEPVGEESIALDVRDTGRGMSHEDRGRAFEPFFTTRADGTGLGLAVVRGIVTELRGEIALDSTLDVGTHVRVVLPCSEAAMRRTDGDG